MGDTSSSIVVPLLTDQNHVTGWLEGLLPENAVAAETW